MTSAVNDSRGVLKGRRKLPITISFTPYAKEKLEEMAAAKGISRSSVAEMAIRDMYRKEGNDGS